MAQLVEVFREVWRVLRDDGVCWVNLGDSYANDGKWGGSTGGRHHKHFHGQTGVGRGRRLTGLKPKDLIGIPWRVAFALQDDGWWLRQDIVWHKPNPMPESVTDRCTKAHEYIFMLTKSERYYFDAAAIAEPAVYSGLANQDESGFKAPQSFNGKHKAGYRSSGNKERKQRADHGGAPGHGGNQAFGVPWAGGTRNKRSVWTVATAPFADAHFATFPPALVEPTILASTSAHGCCRHCGAGWERVVWRSLRAGTGAVKAGVVDERDHGADANDQGANRQRDGHRNGMIVDNETLGWYPDCSCDGLGPLPEYPERPVRGDLTKAAFDAAMDRWRVDCLPVTVRRREMCEAARSAAVVHAVVLDPFGGAGTTGLVADRLRRNAVLIELNPEYAEMARRRIFNDAPLFMEAAQ